MSVRMVASSLSPKPMPVAPDNQTASLKAGSVHVVVATPPAPGEGSWVPLKYFHPGPTSSRTVSLNCTLLFVGGVRAEAGKACTSLGQTLRTVHPVKHLASCSMSSWV